MANSTVADILKTLASTNQLLSIGMTGVSIAVPLIKAAVLEFKHLKDNADGTVEYAIVLKSGYDDLNRDAADFQDALDLVNSELERLGQPPL